MSLQSQPVVNSPTPTLGIPRWVWWAVFVLDSVLMSHWLQAFKVFTVTPSVNTSIPLIFFSACFLAATSLLVYDGYAKEWGKGTIRNTIPWFESVVRWQLMRQPSETHATSSSVASVSLSSVETTV